MAMKIEIISNSPAETMAIGFRLACQFRGGEVIGLCGPLGSGKTHLIKGIVSGVGTEDETVVNSPTFVIVNEYHGKFDIYHIDAYRLGSVSEFEMLGFDEFCHPGSIVLVEWADKVRDILEKVAHIEIELSHAGPLKRIMRFKNLPEYVSMAE